jgi:hypothetical protein
MSQIGKKFAAAVDGDDSQFRPPRTSGVIIDRDLYDSYLSQYHHGQRMAMTMETFLNDGEHQLVMEEARRAGYKIPDEQEFRRELDDYRSFLNWFNPYDVKIMGDGRVRLPLRTARAFHFMGEYNRALVEHVLVSVLHTEYLRRFTDLKRAGFPYAGPTALQETVNTLAAHGLTARQEARQRRIRDWPRFSP